jgi:type II secretory pathway pseudopilin PulG
MAMKAERISRRPCRSKAGGDAPSANGGFTLIEVLIYTVIFSVTSIFLLSILTTVTRTQLKQATQNEVNQQLSFVASTIQRLVRESSVIVNDAGVASTTLVLRMPSPAADTTKIYVDAAKTAIYIEEVPNGSQSGTPLPLTTDKVIVDNFSVTKLENPGGLAVVQVDLSLTYNSDKPQVRVTRSWGSAIARISAATFDSSLVPNASTSPYDIGTGSALWRNLFLSGDASIAGTLGLGVSAPSTPTRLKSGGNVAFSSSTFGPVLMAPNGTSCFRLGISNTGAFTTSSIGCP